ncbi:MAG: hypothetical protein HN712_00215 [Gemmatimonadetes bacterium]|nr:hypothetical protein [Gemmatimonadota bacterium]
MTKWWVTLFSLVLLSAPVLPAPQTLAPDALVPGQRGIGYCVLQGTQVDSFGVEILGVQNNAMHPGRDLILARLSGANLEQTGIIQGMSGSPVYVDGKLIGAVSYGWGFASEPICGITPIGEMLELLERDLSPPNDLPSPPTRSHHTTGGFSPLSLPVWVSGIDAATEAFLADVLEPVGLVPVSGVAGQVTSTAATEPLRPGSSFGVQLVRGDLTMTAIGTVTWVDGNRVLGFGHPYLGAGAIDMPMTRTVIHAVLPNRYSSFVLGSAGEEIGALRQDRATAVAGVLGERAAMLPVTVTVDGPSTQTSLTAQVVDHATFSGALTQIVIYSALRSVEKLLGLASLDVHLRVQLTDGRRVEWNQVFSGLHATLFAAQAVGAPLSELTWSGQEDVHLQSVHVDIRIREDVRVAQIMAARHQPQSPRPGHPMTLQIELDPFQAPREQVEIELPLPATARGLPIQIRIGNGSSALTWAAERFPEPTPRDSDELLARLRRPRRNDDLVVEVIADVPGLALDGTALPALPGSVRHWLQQTPAVGRVGPIQGRVLHSVRLRVPFVVKGEQVIDLGRLEQ